MVERVRTEAENKRLSLATQFDFQQKRLAAANEEQLARMDAEYRAGAIALQNEISELRSAHDKALAGKPENSEADFEGRLAELKAQQESALSATRAERERAVVELKDQEAKTVAKLSAMHQEQQARVQEQKEAEIQSLLAQREAAVASKEEELSSLRAEHREGTSGTDRAERRRNGPIGGRARWVGSSERGCHHGAGRAADEYLERARDCSRQPCARTPNAWRRRRSRRRKRAWRS